jgi:hypothetical protein
VLGLQRLGGACKQCRLDDRQLKALGYLAPADLGELWLRSARCLARSVPAAERALTARIPIGVREND